jgi:hypothetical protein
LSQISLFANLFVSFVQASIKVAKEVQPAPIEPAPIEAVVAEGVQPASLQSHESFSAEMMQKMQTMMMMQSMQSLQAGQQASQHWKPPPSGLPDDGWWGRNTYVGGKTCSHGFLLGCICFVIPGIIYCCCCAQDKRQAYKVDGKIYSPSGEKLGCGGTGCCTSRFVEEMPGKAPVVAPMQRT